MITKFWHVLCPLIKNLKFANIFSEVMKQALSIVNLVDWPSHYYQIGSGHDHQQLGKGSHLSLNVSGFSIKMKVYAGDAFLVITVTMTIVIIAIITLIFLAIISIFFLVRLLPRATIVSIVIATIVSVFIWGWSRATAGSKYSQLNV